MKPGKAREIQGKFRKFYGKNQGPLLWRGIWNVKEDDQLEGETLMGTWPEQADERQP
jgi:hypothetical protein